MESGSAAASAIRLISSLVWVLRNELVTTIQSQAEHFLLASSYKLWYHGFIVGRHNVEA